LGNGFRRAKRLALLGALAASAVASTGSANAAVEPTVLAVKAEGRPLATVGTDRRTHVEYDLIITNVFPEDVTLTSVDVRAGGRTILQMTGDALAAHTTASLGGDPSSVIPASTTKILQVDITLPASTIRRLPRHVGNHISYALSPNSALAAFVGSETVHAPRLKVDRDPVTVVAAPLRGPGWWMVNACCDSTAPHRETVFSLNGTYTAFEMFAADIVQVVDGAFATGDGSQLTDYVGFGQTVYSAAPGKVVATENDRPDAPLTASQFGNPTVTNPSQLAGNHAVVRIAPHVYAVYAHLQPGSVRVHAGEKIGAGEVIGLLGNSGNSSVPHLHFGLNDTKDVLDSDSLPFVIDRMHFAGNATFAGDPVPTMTLTGTPADMHDTYPLNTALVDFAP
jgi:hypothetical protein